MTDFKDYIVAEVTTGTGEKEKYAAELYAYYAVNAPAWDLANAKTNLKKDANGNYVVDEAITAETAKIKAADRFGVNCITKNGSKLVFKNINGVKVREDRQALHSGYRQPQVGYDDRQRDDRAAPRRAC